ncbi:MAG: hypothetical protein ACFFAZ_16675, partial [Promethearchaeota archaeon]
PVDLRIVQGIVGALALFAPIYVARGVHSSYFYLFAMTWTYSYPYFRFIDHFMYMGTFPLTGWRLAFVNQIGRYYRGVSSRKRTVLVGILTEIPILVLLFLMESFPPPGSLLWMPELRTPTPFMLMAGVVFMWFSPFPIPKTYDDKSEPEEWWREDFKAEKEVGFYPLGELDRIKSTSRMACPECGSNAIGREMYPGMFGVRAGFYYYCKRCRRRWR